MPKPVELDVSGEYMNRDGTYKVHASYGKDLATNVVGKYNMVGGDKPVSGEVDVEIMTPNDKYKSMKGHASGSMLLPHEDKHHFEVSCTCKTVLVFRNCYVSTQVRQQMLLLDWYMC